MGEARTDLPGSPLSFSEQFILKLLGQNVDDRFQVDPCKFAVPFIVADFPVAAVNNNLLTFNCPGDPVEGIPPFDTVLPGVPTGPNEQALIDEIKGLRLAVKGAFKTAGLRNVWLTGPYFHNGGKRTLGEVIEFYDDGGDFGIQTNPEKDPDIMNLGLTDQQRADLERFLKSLTDQRLRNESAPYDHPELWVPHGHPGDNLQVAAQGDGVRATDNFEQVPAVGAGGRELLNEFGPLGLYPVHHFMPRYGDVYTSEHEDIIDYHDVAYVTYAVGSSPNVLNDLRDLDNNGVIDGTDVAAVQAACDNPNCAGPKVNKVIQFMLYDAETDLPIGPINYGDTLDIEGKPINIEARVAFPDFDTESVILNISGATNGERSERLAPYTLFGDTDGDMFSGLLNSGVHSLTATPYTQDFSQGTAGEPVTVVFNVGDPTEPIPPPQEGNIVTGFELYNSASNAPLRVLNNGDTVNLGIDCSGSMAGCNVRAVVPSPEGDTQSVRLNLDGGPIPPGPFRNENGAPYFLGGDTAGDVFDLPIGQPYIGAGLTVGSHTVNATPFSDNNGGGTAGPAASVTFNVVN